jgi:hypothetical protein
MLLLLETRSALDDGHWMGGVSECCGVTELGVFADISQHLTVPAEGRTGCMGNIGWLGGRREERDQEKERKRRGGRSGLLTFTARRTG